MSLLKIAASVADGHVLRDKAIELSTQFTKEGELTPQMYEIEIEREEIPIVSPTLQSLIDPEDEETFGGIPSFHTIQIGDVQFGSEPADPSVGIMGDSVWVENFEIVGIDGYAVDNEDAVKLKEEIELTPEEEERLAKSHTEANEPDYGDF